MKLGLAGNCVIGLRISGAKSVDLDHFGGNADIVIEDDKIVEGSKAIAQNQASNIQHPDIRKIDAINKIVPPGLIEKM